MFSIKRWIIFLVIFFIYRGWINTNPIIGGDWPYMFEEIFQERLLFPPAWSYLHGNGLGGAIITYSLDSYLYFGGFLLTKILNIPWSITQKIFWFFPYILLSFFSAYFLMKTVRKEIGAEWESALAGLLYSTNTYILMLVGGGQMGIALAYALLPFSFAFFIQLLHILTKNINRIIFLNKTIFFILVTAFLLVLDIRVTFIFVISALLIIIFYLLIQKSVGKTNIYILFFTFAISSICIVLLQSFWLVPLFFNAPISNQQLGIGQDVYSSLQFFSFANLSNVIGLLHPNWPDNIFGKVTFMRAEFLLMPVLAFTPLLFITQKHKKDISHSQEHIFILFFSFLALLGIFLAKGAKAPFENIYLWLFQNIPGFILFRDPTKWYMLVALSYSVLIPIGLLKVIHWIQTARVFTKNKNDHKVITAINGHVGNLLVMSFVLYLLYLIRPAVMGQLQGTFLKKEIPQEYIQFKNKLVNDEQFSRQLWVPKQHRFTYATRTHPAVEAESLFKVKNNKDLLEKMKYKDAEKILSILGVKYIVIPYDVYGEIFQDDRKYSEIERMRIVKNLDAIPWLQKIQDNKLTIYQNNKYKDLFSLSDSGELSYFPVDNNYKIIIKNDQSADILFAQNYSPYWKVRIDGRIIQASKTKEGIMSFNILQSGMQVVDIFYDGEKYYLYGKLLSGLTLIILLAGYGVLKLKKS